MVKKGRHTTKRSKEAKNSTIATENLKKKNQLKTVMNWKAPATNGLQGYWIKTFTSCHKRIAVQLQLHLEINETPDWFNTGRKRLIKKDRKKGNDVTNFRPIKCLPFM